MSEVAETIVDLPPQNGWMKLWHPAGTLVTLPLTDKPYNYAAALANVSAALAAGWMVQSPGLEPGEEREDVNQVVLRMQQNTDNSETPIVDLYSTNERLGFCIFSHYLNTESDVAAFEKTSGIKLSSLKQYIGTGKLVRGKSKQTDALFTTAARPFQVILKPNPKYNPEEPDIKKRKAKHLFVRWGDFVRPTGEQQTADMPKDDTPDDIGDWMMWLSDQPPIEDINNCFADLGHMSAASKKVLWASIVQYAESQQWVYDKAAKIFKPK